MATNSTFVGENTYIFGGNAKILTESFWHYKNFPNFALDYENAISLNKRETLGSHF